MMVCRGVLLGVSAPPREVRGAAHAEAACWGLARGPLSTSCWAMGCHETWQAAPFVSVLSVCSRCVKPGVDVFLCP